MKPNRLPAILSALAALGLVLGQAPAGHAAVSAADAKTIAGLMKDLDQAEVELTRVEDVAAIKRLQRAYGFYLDKGMWADLSALFADDAVATYPAGVFIGKKSISEHVWQNVGDDKGIGLGDGRLYNHMVLQPVVDVAPDGKTARGRWRVLAMIGRLQSADAKTSGQAQWAGGVYENTYVKDHGVWKIQNLRYYSSFGAPYEGGWAKVTPLPTPARAGGPGGGRGGGGPGRGGGGGGAPAGGAPPAAQPTVVAAAATVTPAPAPTPTRNLAPRHPADAPHPVDCGGFPHACIEPFHYDNPVTGRGNSE